MKAHHRHAARGFARTPWQWRSRPADIPRARRRARRGRPQARWIGPALAAVTEVRFDGWGGVVQEAIDNTHQPYTKKSRVKVVRGTFGDESEIITKVKTANRPATFRSSTPRASNITSAMPMAASSPRSTRPTFPISSSSCRR